MIRRILRRAVRYYYSYLAYQQPLLFQLVPVLATQFQNVFPELKNQEAFVTRVVREEEEAFLRTLERGLKRMEVLTDSARGNTISGQEAFELSDTYGFPLDLTQLIASEKGLQVDEAGFNEARKAQQERGRKAGAIETEDWVQVAAGDKNSFVGYDVLETNAQILKYRKVTSKGKEAFQVVLDRTPFYAESGGQAGDRGELILEAQKLSITDTKKENDLIIHFCEAFTPHQGGNVRAKVDAGRRQLTSVHHTATHLLHAALRQILGVHVAQKGSLVTANHLRFDFTHFSKLTETELQEIENVVNEKIRQNIPVVVQTMPKEEALKTGATALFGEKYGDLVRVITIDPAYSIELCGGTHLQFTGEAGLFKLTTETAVAAGVRRIEAVCGFAAEQYTNSQLLQLLELKNVLKGAQDPVKAVRLLVEENTALKKMIQKAEQDQLSVIASTLEQKTQSVNGFSFIGARVDTASPEALKKLALASNADLTVLTANIESKAHVAISLSKNLIDSKGLDAVVIIRQQVAPLIKGGGGGQKSLASAGGTDSSALHTVIETVKALL